MHPPQARTQALENRLARGDALPVAQAALQLVGKYPQSFVPWGILARALTAAGQRAEAQTAWQQARGRAPGVAEKMRLAQMALDADEQDIADGLLLAACQANPGNIGALLSLSRVRRARGLAAAARPVAELVVRAHPDSAECWLQLAEVHSELAALRAARDAAHKAVSLAPDDMDLHEAAARVLLGSGFVADADAVMQGVVGDSPRSQATRGLIHARAGRSSDAVLALDPWVLGGHANAVELSVWGRLLSKTPRAAEAQAVLLEKLQGHQSPPSRRMLLHRVGDLAESQERWGDAFAAHAAANASGRLPWPAAHFDAEVAAIRRLAATPSVESGNAPGAGLVLIAGLPRSGTSLLEQVLAAHPAVLGLGESPMLRDVLDALPGDPATPWPDRLAACGAEARRQAGARYLAHLDAELGPAIVRIDKTPSNLLYVDALARILPGAKAILMHRNALDAGTSCFFQGFGPYFAWTDDLTTLGHVARHYGQLRDQWVETAPLPVLHVSYEALVHQPEDQVRRVLDFVGLPWDPVVLDFHTTGREMRTASFDQVRQPINTRSVGRGEHYRPWLGPFIDALEGR